MYVLQLYQWSTAVVASYSFVLGDDHFQAMVPVWDLLNHITGKVNVKLHHDPEKGVLQVGKGGGEWGRGIGWVKRGRVVAGGQGEGGGGGGVLRVGKKGGGVEGRGLGGGQEGGKGLSGHRPACVGFPITIEPLSEDANQNQTKLL